MAKKDAKKVARPMARKQMKKTKGGFAGFGGGVTVAAGDVNGDNVGTLSNTINGGTLGGPDTSPEKKLRGSFTGGV
ncbi:MAG TPA: hypothetical protein VE981_18485 [Planctomycetota bacterium]|nr:hypothetical protein [Planctomycetota bacterium]